MGAGRHQNAVGGVNTFGAWPYFPTDQKTIFHATMPASRTPVQAPAVLGWNLIGNPFNVPATLPPTLIAYYWDASADRYVRATTVPTGAAVWVYALASGAVTLREGIPDAG